MTYIQPKKFVSLKYRKSILIRLAVLVCILILLLFISAFDSNIAFAGEDNDDVASKLSSAVNDTIDNLDLKALQDYLNSLTNEQKQGTFLDDVKENLRLLIDGQGKVFYEEFINLVGKYIGNYFVGFLPSFVTIIIICLLNSLLSSMSADFVHKETSEVAHIVCYSAIVIVLMSGVVNIITTVSDTITSLINFSNALFPTLLTLLSVLGGAQVVATYSPLMAIFTSLIMKMISVVILPSFVAVVVFSVVGNISKTVKLDKLTKLIKSVSTWLLGIVFGVFASFLTAQGITGGVVDKFGFNIAKFALSSYVPILGGYLSDGIDLISASVVLVKNALGYTGVIILISVVLFPLVKVVIFTLTLRLTSAIAEPIGDNRVAMLLHSVAGSMNLLVSALAGVAFMFFILIMLLIGSCNMGV